MHKTTLVSFTRRQEQDLRIDALLWQCRKSQAQFDPQRERLTFQADVCRHSDIFLSVVAQSLVDCPQSEQILNIIDFPWPLTARQIIPARPR